MIINTWPVRAPPPSGTGRLAPRALMTTMSYETSDKDDSERLDEPIKIRWTGYARGRIHEYNGQYEDDGWDGDVYLPSVFCLTMERQKTNVVVTTVLEANSIRYELMNYGSHQRTWMNSSMDKSLRLVGKKLDEAMRGRGYEPTWGQSGPIKVFEGYEPA